MGEWAGVLFTGVHEEQVTRRRTHEDVIVELPRCSFRLEIVPNRRNKRKLAAGEYKTFLPV
ncbi:uncharacterized protein PgNI_07332 [Pyricularia grisea]|uniref:Uncharacterized protein n=1 Tax=Pyricularia grisea TaxID=148305 RepID=A0A6P8B118_PYRGI|nr:uncharacterized protein PgNI_07332 [Pyricularia grisea]TLD08526.1 hypothetical protein PgNI_07332 [Pyricularia grisea]